MGIIVNETGNKYGRLTVIERIENSSRRALWRCKCICGGEKIVFGYDLRNGHVKSCGCLPRGGRKVIDETGNRYGRLVVLKQVGTKYGQAAWLCRCDCGNEKVVGGYKLRKGNTKSCGCLQRELARERIILPDGDATFNLLFSRMYKEAEKRNLEWNLTKEQVRTLTKQNCYYCGNAPNQLLHRKHCNGDYIYNGIDRMDNTKGYFINNVVPCCKHCNFAKRTMTIEQFEDWIVSIYTHSIAGRKETHAES